MDSVGAHRCARDYVVTNGVVEIGYFAVLIASQGLKSTFFHHVGKGPASALVVVRLPEVDLTECRQGEEEQLEGVIGQLDGLMIWKSLDLDGPQAGRCRWQIRPSHWKTCARPQLGPAVLPLLLAAAVSWLAFGSPLLGGSRQAVCAEWHLNDRYRGDKQLVYLFRLCFYAVQGSAIAAGTLSLARVKVKDRVLAWLIIL
ncbi:hypothetical protein C7212DRAFT_365219 [Tuber magnatum]|uniref:Uncharacterized protein n=1 Tax=Tuber magnatum TaxID=42249 RepID=A0A317SMQ1_9PEZI|nr:hypothetical protein C7212DRAFT_365219 [Tuber magnatum]